MFICIYTTVAVQLAFVIKRAQTNVEIADCNMYNMCGCSLSLRRHRA